MPNGRPGDHPLIDIVDHHIETYSKRADDIVRDLSTMLSNDLLWEFLYYFDREGGVIKVMGSKRRIPISEFEEMLEGLYKKISSWKSEDLQRFENDAEHLLQEIIKQYEGKLPK